jgi:hypothetical protein
VPVAEERLMEVYRVMTVTVGTIWNVPVSHLVI